MPNQILTGIEVLEQNSFKDFRGEKVGLVCNQGSVTKEAKYTLDLFRQAHKSGLIELKAIFGPQHGLFGHTQDNMIEWESEQADELTGAPIYSLYGEHREPTEAMLREIDTLVIDLRDIGARYYTFIWSTALCLKACEALGKKVIILDRPNPLGGIQREGTVLNPKFASFVGLHPLPMRHGLTLGELATHFKTKYYPKVNLKIVRVLGWQREELFPETSLLWAMPSPNMPGFEAAMLYPGMCLLEGTNISEGRGTTKPFEIIGAPYIDGWDLARDLNNLDLRGIYFRPLEFQPTFQKHSGKICGGVYIHLTDPAAVQPVRISTAILHQIFKDSNGKAKWNPPPYEYEYVKLPIDILAGNDWYRPAIESGTPINEIFERMENECKTEWDPQDIERLY